MLMYGIFSIVKGMIIIVGLMIVLDKVKIYRKTKEAIKDIIEHIESEKDCPEIFENHHFLWNLFNSDEEIKYINKEKVYTAIAEYQRLNGVNWS